MKKEQIDVQIKKAVAEAKIDPNPTPFVDLHAMLGYAQQEINVLKLELGKAEARSAEQSVIIQKLTEMLTAEPEDGDGDDADS